jgi:hypothetical protein
MSDKAHPSSMTIVIVAENPTSSQLLGRVRRIAGSVIIVSSPDGLSTLSTEHLSQFFKESKALNLDRRLVLATKDPQVRTLASRHGWETVQTLKQLKPLVKGHQGEAEALRIFSPVRWRQDIRTRLQSVGLLTLPKVRIWLLFFLSILVFFFAFFKLLPSAEIRIWPDQESGSFTTNVYLMASGAILPVPADRVRSLPLELLTVTITRSITYDQISKNFTGTNARMTVTVFNESDEEYSLRKGTRLTNQAGMRFRLNDQLILPAHSKADARVEADPIDQYGEVLGARGNVPAGVKWNFPGLSEREQFLVYARNDAPATGGTTSYVNKVTLEDIEGSNGRYGARHVLEQELLTVAKQEVEEQRQNKNKYFRTHLVQLDREELTKVVYEDFDLAANFIGENVSSIPLQGSIRYTVILYDENELLRILSSEVLSRIPSDKTIVESSLVKENMDLNVIAPWDDNFLWVKITADLTYTERYVIKPITPAGAILAKYIRDNVVGKSIPEAYRIIRNLPEVDAVEISVWPPWTYVLPSIGNSIAITEK